MSIDAKLDALIAALDRNTAALLGSAPAEKKPRKVAAPSTAEIAAATAVLPTPGVLPVPVAPAPVPAPVTATGGVGGSGAKYTVKDIAETVLKVHSVKGRDVTVKLLAQFGAPNAKDVKPEQYGEFMAVASQLLNPAPAPSTASDLV